MLMSGNDYLPKLSFVGLDRLLDCYKKSGVENLIKKNMTFDLKSLLTFFQLLCSHLPPKYNILCIKTYDEQLIKEYLEGLLWCLKMYCMGVCSKYDYVYGYGKSPTPIEILFFLVNNKSKIKTPYSTAKPIPVDIYSAIVFNFKQNKMNISDLKILSDKSKNISL